MTIDELLAEARAGLERLTPEQAAEAMQDGALLIDVRSEVWREREGVVLGSLFIPRNVLEWRCDPCSESRDPRVPAERETRLIVMCEQGYQSSLAAATLQRVGYPRATDLIGGFEGWAAAGLPVTRP
jgi:rhodanese-related sulfurtransferase